MGARNHRPVHDLVLDDRPGDIDLTRGLLAGAFDREVDDRSGRTANRVEDLVLFGTGGRSPVDSRDPVADLEPGRLCGRPGGQPGDRGTGRRVVELEFRSRRTSRTGPRRRSSPRRASARRCGRCHRPPRSSRRSRHARGRRRRDVPRRRTRGGACPRPRSRGRVRWLRGPRLVRRARSAGPRRSPQRRGRHRWRRTPVLARENRGARLVERRLRRVRPDQERWPGSSCSPNRDAPDGLCGTAEKYQPFLTTAGENDVRRGRHERNVRTARASLPVTTPRAPTSAWCAGAPSRERRRPCAHALRACPRAVLRAQPQGESRSRNAPRRRDRSRVPVWDEGHVAPPPARIWIDRP